MAALRVLAFTALLGGACRWEFEHEAAPAGADAAGVADAPGAGFDAPLPDVAAFDGPNGGVDAGPPDAFSCPPNYTMWGTSCYYFELDLVRNWMDAELDCEALGSHLAVVDDSAENAFLLGQLTLQAGWIGASDRVTEGTYLTVTGLPLPWDDWGSNEPAGASSGDDCATFWNSNWRDESCTMWAYRYACELDGRPADPSSY